MKLQRKGLYIKSPFVCNFILGTYFFANNKTKPPYVVAKSDNKQYIAARCRRHGSDLHASCGESSDLVFRLKQQLNLPWRWTYHMFGQDNNSKKKKKKNVGAQNEVAKKRAVDKVVIPWVKALFRVCYMLQHKLCSIV